MISINDWYRIAALELHNALRNICLVNYIDKYIERLKTNNLVLLSNKSPPIISKAPKLLHMI
jgi:hypothetical protein